MEQADHTEQVAESILRFCPGFKAFKLSPPSVDEEAMKNINRNRSQINSEFFSEKKKLQVLLKSTLTPKRSFNDGELVTGQDKAYRWIFCQLPSPVREQHVTSHRFMCIFQKLTVLKKILEG